MVALAVYAFGKTFFWPTMLAVVGDRFPRTGAVAMSIMGGIGMMSAGLLGGPGLGYAKDRFTAEHLDGHRAGDLRAVQGAGAEQVPLPQRGQRPRRHEAVGRPDGSGQDTGAADCQRRQHRRRPRDAQGRLVHPGCDGRRSICCCSCTSRRLAVTSRCASTRPRSRSRDPVGRLSPVVDCSSPRRGQGIRASIPSVLPK